MTSGPLERVITTRVAQEPCSKRTARSAALDILVASLLLFFLAPLLAMIAVLVRLESPGPALFRQTRTGLNGRTFQILKFRSMRVQENGSDVRQASRADARVTPFGALLRKSSLDELPQLINVLRGEMSLVGPRPHALAHDAYYSSQIANYNDRFHVRPGLTGWAQINGSRGETPLISDMQRRVDYDVWYVQNRSLRLDLKILVATGSALVAHRSNTY